MVVKNKKNQSGQALIEFLIFLPFMVILYGIILTIADSINGSINQQKVTRSYFFYRLKNNSQITKPYRVQDGSVFPLSSFTLYGHYFLGWADYVDGGSVPVAPCYKVNLPLFGSNAQDVCSDKYTQSVTQNIRIGTVYGLCGVTFFKGSDQYLAPGPVGPVEAVVSPEGCHIKK
jgi:hypothetical protein